MNNARFDILNKVMNREISPEEGAARIADLESEEAPYTTVTELPPAAENFRPEIGLWKHAWLIPFWIGTAIFILGAFIMAWAYPGRHFFWFYCSWLPMLFGLLLLFLGWWSQRARWLHVRVQDQDGKNVAISLPLPLGLAAWLLRVFGPWIPQLRDQHFTDLPPILESLSGVKEPLSVEVDDNGSRVRVYIL